MLGKLMKYDLRSGIRTFSLIWIGLALLGAINGLTIRFVLADGYFCPRFYHRPVL